MKDNSTGPGISPAAKGFLFGFLLGVVVTAIAWKCLAGSQAVLESESRPESDFQPRRSNLDTSGLTTVYSVLEPWQSGRSLAEIASAWDRVGHRNVAKIDLQLQDESSSSDGPARANLALKKASLLNYEGEPNSAYEVLEQLRSTVEGDGSLAPSLFYSIIYFQGVTALRRGETENCIMCRGESSCILPISRAAVHTKPEGSRLAIRHFTEYLDKFPDDLEVQWLLNLAHMTLGEHPDAVDPRFLISLDRFTKSEFDIGRFRDIGNAVGLDRFNQAGGAVMEDFDNDGLLDIAVTTWDATRPMAIYRNTGAGTFEECSETAGILDQLGGLNCMQTDYNNDGRMDIFIVRGAWVKYPMRPTLLRNDGHWRFTDVTEEAGLVDPVNSIAAAWADYDNDGWLDVFICCEQQPSRFYRNLGHGAFEDVSQSSQVQGSANFNCKGAAWIDYDNDDFPDLFLNYHTPHMGTRLLHNNRDGTFIDVGFEKKIDGPKTGFSCWAFDYDNDGWLDIFATSYDRSLGDAVKGLLGRPHYREFSRLYHNNQGRDFDDKTKEAGLDMVFGTMGSNFGDFDNDGFLDIYLGTGEPDIEFLVPNRMFKNVAGKRFAEITGAAGTGNLQKGHGVACGDWDRDGDTDLFIEMGGATNGDKYHNILFQNPGQKHHWLTVKLIGKKSNRPAIGARIKVVTAGPEPLTVHRHISSGSSFGANPLQQTIGLADASRVASLEIHWPTSGTTQVFQDIAADQAIEITEYADSYRPLDWKPIPVAVSE